MGKVFTWSEIQSGYIPEKENFALVVEYLLQKLLSENVITSAVLCGSINRGDSNLRSDVDCFVSYDLSYEDKAFAIMQDAVDMAATQYVPLSFIPCDSVVVQTSMHHIGPSFLRHLERSLVGGLLVKGDLSRLVGQSVSVAEELEWYVRVKMYSLQEALASVSVFSEERLVNYLRKLLEAPLHVARKVLAYQEQLPDDSKAFVQGRYKELMSKEMSSQLDSLMMLDSEYTIELIRQLNSPKKVQYERFLSYLTNESGAVLSFIRSNLLFLESSKAR